MNSYINKCLLCLLYNRNIKNIVSEDTDGIVVEVKVKHILSEQNTTLYYNKIVSYESHKPKYICEKCLDELNRLYKFKQKCLSNLKFLSDYIDEIIADNTDAKRSNNKDIVEPTHQQANYDIEKVEIKSEPLDTQHNTATFEEQTSTNNLQEETSSSNVEQVVVKGEPEEFHYEIDIKQSPLLSGEAYSDDVLEDEPCDTLSEEPYSEEMLHNETSDGGYFPTSITDASPRPHQCTECTKSFKRANHLKRHILIHSGEKRYQCDICNKTLTGHNHLVTHKRIHTGEKPYQCDVCDKAFSQKINLITHKRVHTGEKPYQCDACDKAFTDKPNLIRHKRTHSGERPYKCEICSKTFGYKNSLSTHQRTHTGVKPYKCDVCDKAFGDKTSMISHKHTHTGERPFECEVCPYKCISRSGLQLHIKRRHSSNTASAKVRQTKSQS